MTTRRLGCKSEKVSVRELSFQFGFMSPIGKVVRSGSTDKLAAMLGEGTAVGKTHGI